MSGFYDCFERHGDGLKRQSTHYCAGCGHGVVHRYLARAIERLGIQERTVAVSPVGCGVFLYYYLDAANTQAAHGRASAVAVGHKLAHPASIVVSYQGDGDLASIGLNEIMQAAQLGVPISVVYVNNAIYGMTGGQLAPTTLMGQRTTTSPTGRSARMGHPLRMAEMIASLEGPAYVERVALFDAKQRARAARAIEKALRVQVENRGLAFIEVLAECPTHLRLSATEAERWVAEHMTPVFPLGVKKDLPEADYGTWDEPRYEAEHLLASLGVGPATETTRASTAAPGLFGDDVGLKLAGAGGDGAQTAALLLAQAAIDEGFDATHIPSYGPESRGGTSYADVRIAAEAVLSPDVPEPHVLVAFNAPSLARFAPTVPAGGVIVYDADVVARPNVSREGVRVLGVPCTSIARELGEARVKNIVALGAVQFATRVLPSESLGAALRRSLGKKPGLMAANEEALRRGAGWVAAATA